MKVAVIGSRGFDNYARVVETLSRLQITEIISGGAIGADRLAERYAKENNIPITVFYPDWSLGKHAGMIRNTQIINAAECVVAFWDGESKGTHDSIKKARAAKKQVLVVMEPKNGLLFD